MTDEKSCCNCRHSTVKVPCPAIEGASCDYCRSWRVFLPVVGSVERRPVKACSRWEVWEK